jgi:hypothetical protein
MRLRFFGVALLRNATPKNAPGPAGRVSWNLDEEK